MCTVAGEKEGHPPAPSTELEADRAKGNDTPCRREEGVAKRQSGPEDLCVQCVCALLTVDERSRTVAA